MKLAQAFGLPAANVTIADFKDTRVLVVERFDRALDEGRPAPQITAGRLLPGIVRAADAQV